MAAKELSCDCNTHDDLTAYIHLSELQCIVVSRLQPADYFSLDLVKRQSSVAKTTIAIRMYACMHVKGPQPASESKRNWIDGITRNGQHIYVLQIARKIKEDTFDAVRA